MSAWLVGYLAGVVTVPAVVLLWLGWAVWRNPNSCTGVM